MKKPQALIGLLAALGTAIGVLVAVVGLPYGRANYTAFADLYHNGGTPALGVVDIALDCDTGTGGVQSVCVITIPGPATTDVDVTIGNNTASAKSIGSLNFVVFNPDSTELFADNDNANPGANDDNPDYNQAGAFGNLACTPPDPDNDLTETPGQQDSFLSCFTGAANGPALPNDSVHITMATMHYTVMGTAVVGDTTELDLQGVAISDNSLTEIGSCDPTIDVAAACFNATINFEAPPPATVTNTPEPTDTATSTPIPPSPTNTPAGPTVNKVPECDDGVPSADDLASITDNSDDTDVTANQNCTPGPNPAANLWLCVAPAPCDDAGEGSLHVLEVATNVDTLPIGPGGDGLGAYEFVVEYDHFVISSVNPCDIVFGPGGAGSARGPVDEVNSSSPANADCTPDPNVNTDGQCTQSLILENLVRFGCVTVGALPPGPTTPPNITLASLELVPHEDLKQDIFPGNDNGVVTIIKDNGCELVDIFGHAVLGSINGGLTLECGNLAVTIRILEGDLDLDCDVDVTDAQLIATKYGSFFGSLIYGKWYDLEPAFHDLDIDIKDLQKVFGRIGSACQEPVPAQPPVSFP